MAQKKKPQKPCHGSLEEAESSISPFSPVPAVGNPEKRVLVWFGLVFPLGLTEARALPKRMSSPVVSNSISVEGLHSQPQCSVNTQFLDALPPKSAGVISSLWPRSVRNMAFWEAFASSPSAGILKGPCQVLKGVTTARIPISQAPEGRSCQLAHIHTRNGWISVVLCVWSWLSSPG